MTALVTGATGFVGSAVVRALLTRGEAVRVMVRAGSDRRHLDGLPVEVVTGDLDRPETLPAATAGASALFHVAADYRIWVPIPDLIYRTNVQGSRALMRAAAEAGVRRIVYTSSVATLGLTADGLPADETTPTSLARMTGHYKRSKYLAEQTLLEMIEREALPAVIVNPSAPVGPRDSRPTPTGRMVLEAARGRMPAYVDTGLNLVHVEDVAAGHLLAFDHGRIGERYILGGDNLELGEILKIIARLCGRRAPRLKLPVLPLMPLALVAEGWARATRRMTEPMLTVDALRMARKRMFFTSAKAAAEIGYRSRPATDALADALAWYRAQGYLD